MRTQIQAKDKEHLVLRRMPAVPNACAADNLDNVYPFEGDDLVLPRQSALRMCVRRTRLITAVHAESDDAHSLATTRPAEVLGEREGERQEDGEGRKKQGTGSRKWLVLDGCELGEFIAMHTFTFCKWEMLAVESKSTRSGATIWEPLVSGTMHQCL